MKFKIGEWFAVDNCGDFNKDTWVGRIGEEYEYNEGTKWTFPPGFIEREARKATEDEIKNAIIKECKRRGLMSPGAQIKSFQGVFRVRTLRYEFVGHDYAYEGAPGLYLKQDWGIWLFYAGKFAKVLLGVDAFFHWALRKHPNKIIIGLPTSTKKN